MPAPNGCPPPAPTAASIYRLRPASSTSSPRSCRTSSSRSRGGRGKLPTCVTRMRPSLRSMPPSLHAARLPTPSDPEAPDPPGDEPGRVPLEEDGDLAVAGDDRLPAAPGDGADDLPRRRGRGHDEGPGQRRPRLRMPHAPVVHLADLARDEARTDERHRNAVGCQLVAERLGEPAHGELAHRVRARTGHADVAVHAAQDDQAPVRLLEILERRVHRPQHPEDIGLELGAVVVERQRLERAGHAEARVRPDHVDAPERPAPCLRASSFCASSGSGRVSGLSLPASAFLTRSSACLMTTGQLNAHDGTTTAREMSTTLASLLMRFFPLWKFNRPTPCSQSDLGAFPRVPPSLTLPPRPTRVHGVGEAGCQPLLQRTCGKRWRSVLYQHCGSSVISSVSSICRASASSKTVTTVTNPVGKGSNTRLGSPAS